MTKIKRYEVNDFTTPFGQSVRANIETNNPIDWDLLEKYENTNLHEAFVEASKKFNHRHIDAPINLSDGQSVSPQEFALYVQNFNDNELLNVIKHGENFFQQIIDDKKPVNVPNIIARLSDPETRTEEDRQFGNTIIVYPTIASQMYFQFRYAQAMTHPEGYKSITESITQSFEAAGYPPGRLPNNSFLDGEKMQLIVESYWPQLEDMINEKIIPRLNQLISTSKGPGSGGPVRH